MKRVAIVGFGKVGKAYAKLFPDAVIYDPPLEDREQDDLDIPEGTEFVSATKEEVNECDIALVCVFTPLTEDEKLDGSIVEEVVDWLETPLILIKSALQPGTVDYLVEKTGKKIAVSVEFVGEGSYPIHFWKYPHQDDPRLHTMLIVGGEQKTAEACAEILWARMSPDIKIHIMSAREAEINKLIENAYGALKVTFMNTILSLTQKADVSFIKVHQGWQSDPRTDSMHLRAVTFNRGWKSKCWDKDVPALKAYAGEIGAHDCALLFSTIMALNKLHLEMNSENPS